MVREIGGKSYYWKFPSPCGEKVGINLRECLCRLYSCEWFPSPCGEKVGINIRGLIKLRIERGEVREVSVPLRGKGRDQHPGDTKRSGTANHVSVPLRGKGRDQLTMFTPEQFLKNKGFPSPCGEKVGINRGGGDGTA